jgi:hypothetical protein
MRKLFGIVTVLCLLTRVFPVLALDNSNGASGGYLGSNAFFHREIDGAGQRALARSALSTHSVGTRRHKQRATHRVEAGTGVWARMAREDREKGYFRIRAGQPRVSPPGRAVSAARRPRVPAKRVNASGTRAPVRSMAAQGYRPPVSDGSYHSPVSDGSHQAPTTGR